MRDLINAIMYGLAEWLRMFIYVAVLFPICIFVLISDAYNYRKK